VFHSVPDVTPRTSLRAEQRVCMPLFHGTSPAHLEWLRLPDQKMALNSRSVSSMTTSGATCSANARELTAFVTRMRLSFNNGFHLLDTMVKWGCTDILH
jgi:hypothetical protein